MKIYLVVNEWANDVESGVYLDAFDTYEKAKDAFEKKIEQEITDGLDYAFEDGKVCDGYALEESVDRWSFWEPGYREYNHTTLEIREKIVK